MAENTKAGILELHSANTSLNASLPPQARRAEGDFSADESYRPLDERIIAGAADALDAGHTHYVDVPGIAPLREELAQFLNAATASSYQAGNIIITAGMQEARFLTIQKVGERHDSIAIPAVVHPGVRKALGVRQLNVVTLDAESARGYLPTVAAIGAAVAEGCRLLYLESPSRLSGAAYSADEVRAIGDILRDNDAAAIWDQGLCVWIDGDYAGLAAQEEGAPQRIATIGEGWHGMGLGSWFIGYIAAPESWIPAMQSQKQIMAICTSTATQYAALAASELYQAARDARLAQLGRIRGELLEQAKAAGFDVVSGGAFNVIALRPDGGVAAAIARLRSAGYDAADGRDFGAPDAIRLTVNDATERALAVLSEAP